MFLLKSMLYFFTVSATLFFAYLEWKIKQEVTEGAMPNNERVSDIGLWNDFSKRIVRERILQNLPREKLHKYRTAVALKFLFAAFLVVEVLVLQR
jgi:hypothetical protein